MAHLNDLPLFDLAEHHPIQTIDMHTCGEPTRIIYDGFPILDDTTTLLEQRAEAERKFDHVRTRLLLEPRGHYDMYGALLCPQTELTRSGDADIGVLFMTNSGWSTMCGHATIALGRYLVDRHQVGEMTYLDAGTTGSARATFRLRLHAPCGVIEVETEATNDLMQNGKLALDRKGWKSDPKMPVSFVGVPSWASGIAVRVTIPAEEAWPELGDRRSITVDFCYGGTFYAVVLATELGFRNGLRQLDLDAMRRATAALKAAVKNDPRLTTHYQHPTKPDLSFLYGVLVEDETLGQSYPGSSGADTGICFFADDQIDRSPCGSGVMGRVALKYAKEELVLDQSWTYHSLVSNETGGQGAFTGEAVEECDVACMERFDEAGVKPVKVKVEGYAYYTGRSTFVVEPEDPLGDKGFAMSRLCR